MIAAVRVRGDVDVSHKVSRTLQDLNLEKKNSCVVFEDTESVRGMLKVGKDYIAYGEISEDTVEKLSERNGEEVKSGNVINLSPPSGGYRDTKRQVQQGGALGKRENMDELVQKMV